jgi:hypothetical protein
MRFSALCPPCWGAGRLRGRPNRHLLRPDRAREPAPSAAVNPATTAPGRRGVFARTGGSNIGLPCSCAGQGGRHVDMVVGAHHRNRGFVGDWHAAAAPPLTARRPGPVTAALLLDQADEPAAWPVRLGPAGTDGHPVLPGPAGAGMQPGLDQCRSATANRYDLHPAGTGMSSDTVVQPTICGGRTAGGQQRGCSDALFWA